MRKVIINKQARQPHIVTGGKNLNSENQPTAVNAKAIRNPLQRKPFGK